VSLTGGGEEEGAWTVVDGKITMGDTVISPQFRTVDEAVMEATLVMDEYDLPLINFRG